MDWELRDRKAPAFFPCASMILVAALIVRPGKRDPVPLSVAVDDCCFPLRQAASGLVLSCLTSPPAREEPLE